jgi:hypothetical protein
LPSHLSHSFSGRRNFLMYMVGFIKSDKVLTIFLFVCLFVSVCIVSYLN